MVYVDDMRKKFGRYTLFNMTADTEAELDSMAKELGLSNTWKSDRRTSGARYEVTTAERKRAVSAGATQVTRKFLFDEVIHGKARSGVV